MGKPSSSQREPFACPPDFLQKNFLARSLATHFVPVLISLSLGERGRISQHWSHQIISGRERRGYPKTRYKRNRSWGPREKEGKKGRRGGGGNKKRSMSEHAPLQENEKQKWFTRNQKPAPFPADSPAFDSVPEREAATAKGARGAGSRRRRRPAPRPPAQVIPTFRSCMHQPGWGAHNLTRNLAVHLPICTARIREI